MRAVWSYPVLALAIIGVLGVPNSARAQNAAKKTAADDEFNNFFEIDGYAGYSDYQRIPAGLGSKILQGAILGGRVTENIWNHVSLEESFNAYSWNKYNFLSNPADGAVLQPPFPVHTFQPAFDVVYNFTPRTSRFRPFILAGPGWTIDEPGKNAYQFARSFPPGTGFATFRDDAHFQGNYGGGVKYQINKWFGVRGDVRGLIGLNPTFGLPTNTSSGVYIPNHKLLNGIQVTAGLILYLGHRGEKPAPPPPPPPPPPAPKPISGGSVMLSPTSVCPGDAVMLSSNASDPEGHQLNYEWTANGSQIGTGSQYTYHPMSSGDVMIGLTVSDATNSSRTANAMPASLHVNTYSAPMVSGVTADPASLEQGQNAMLHVNAMGSQCSGTLTYSWAATEGTVTGNGPDATFNSSPVSFNADRSRPQSKQVTVTATVTDSKGGTGSATTTVTVNLEAQAKHFGDILFPKNSARVNNCGKRVLIEQLYPQLTANPNYDVVLVGHIGQGEMLRIRRRGRRGRVQLDRERVLQTAAVLSGGTGTCSSLDTSRIRGVWVGATQMTESVPTSCALSTAAPKERRGQAVTDVDQAKDRRVEIWLVPKGMSLPSAATGASELPETDLKAIGCPK